MSAILSSPAPYLILHHAYTIATDDVTEELNFSLEEFTLALLRIARASPYATPRALYAHAPYAPRGSYYTIDEDIIEEHENKLIEERTKGLMHEMHEGTWGISQTER